MVRPPSVGAIAPQPAVNYKKTDNLNQAPATETFLPSDFGAELGWQADFHDLPSSLTRPTKEGQCPLAAPLTRVRAEHSGTTRHI